MRALVLTNLYPPNAMGGYELSCRDVVDRWRADGHDVTVLTTRGSLSGTVEPLAAEPHVVRALSWYWEDHVFLTPSRGEILSREAANHVVLRTVVDDLRPDVVSAWHMGGMSLSLLTAVEDLGLPLVANICDEWPVYGPVVDPWTAHWSRWPGRLRRHAGRSPVPRRAPRLDGPASFVSAYTRDVVRAESRWPFTDAEVVGSGVDLVDFPLSLKERGRDWQWQLLAVGRVEPRKGFDVAVAALALLPGACLRIIGVADPGHLLELTQRATRLGVGDRVRFEAVPRKDLRQAYAEADAVLFTSRWQEPFGLVPLEAMTQSTPVVATRRGGSAEFLVDGLNCLEIPVDDPAALARAVQRLSVDPGLRDVLVQGGHEVAARYTTDGLARRLLALHLRATAR